MLNLTNFFRDVPKMQQFWENLKIAHLSFVLEMRTFSIFVLKNNEKHLVFIFTKIQLNYFPFDFHRALQPPGPRHNGAPLGVRGGGSLLTLGLTLCKDGFLSELSNSNLTQI